MNCPIDNEKLEKVLFHKIEVDHCPQCLGVWFDVDELRQAKDVRDQQLNWIDVDLWRDKGKFKISQGNKKCPIDRTVLREVQYDQSKTKVDFCKMCNGVWLDRGEFKQIVNYLKTKSDYEILHNYTKNLTRQLWEVFSGPATFREELEDFLMVLKLFNYKFQAQHPHINKLIQENLPK